MKRIALAVAMFLSLAAPAWAGFGDGLTAYQLGDYAMAFRQWKPLAEQGDVLAQVFLGDMYSKGQSVPQDHAEAAKWYRRAAGQGVAAAQLNLGVLYSKGWGVKQNYVQAHLWFSLATFGALWVGR